MWYDLRPLITEIGFPTSRSGSKNGLSTSYPLHDL